MNLKQIKVAGFRGFNVEEAVDFDSRLTLVSAPNSHGKTSITEALEFLIYGVTSKVDQARSKEEFKDSYRNRHYPPGLPSHIEAMFEKQDGTMTTLRVELDAGGDIRRFVDGTPVSAWPFAHELPGTARPFVVQHALKDLLLVAPSERFQGFARLLGLNDIDRIQQALVNLCTKPEANIPEKAKRSLADLAALEARLSAVPELQSATKDFKRGIGSIDATYKKIEKRAEVVLGAKPKLGETLSALVAARDKASSTVFSGSVGVKAATPAETGRMADFHTTLTTATGASFIENYGRLATRDATERLQKEGSLLSLGLELLGDAPDICPLCSQPLNETLTKDIAVRNEAVKEKLGDCAAHGDPRTYITQRLAEIETTVAGQVALIDGRFADLLAAGQEEAQEKIKRLFGAGNEASWEITKAAIDTLEASRETLRTAISDLQAKVEQCRGATESHKEEITQAEALVRATKAYLAALDSFYKKVDEIATVVAGPAHLLRQAIDAVAGTTELSLLIEVLEKRKSIETAFRLRGALDSVRDLKKHVDQTVGEVMEAAFGTDLTSSVMSWYGKIRTSGDPDVHFSGFSMEKTKAGDYKNRRVKVGAQSYGVELASAVSSLSESKLNALGLCVSIATALRAPGPWGFLVLDDPIQSWDADHETQFINIIRSLAEQENKQVILLSHRHDWIDQVSLGCRSLNGLRYCITGYTKDGPKFAVLDWAPVDQRLREALAIANNASATPVRLQQAEEEIRIAASQIVADIARRKLRRERGSHNMNSQDARGILTEAGCPSGLIDRTIASFGSSDKSHHAPKDYQPNAQRIRQYHGTLVELGKWGE